MTYETFKACDDLEPEEFACFTAQYVNSFNRLRTCLKSSRNTAARADADAQHFAAAINRIKADARRHGVELPE